MAYDQDGTTENGKDPDQVSSFQRGTSSEAGCYEIRVRGHLNGSWSEWLDGLQVKLLENGEMVLYGTLPDQAALQGVLAKIYRLNLTLISINPCEEGGKNERT